MYLCDICEQPSERGAPKLRHVIKRKDGNIARELAVCVDCNRRLASGATPDQLRRAWKARLTGQAVAAAPQQPKPAPILNGGDVL